MMVREDSRRLLENLPSYVLAGPAFYWDLTCCTLVFSFPELIFPPEPSQSRLTSFCDYPLRQRSPFLLPLFVPSLETQHALTACVPTQLFGPLPGHLKEDALFWLTCCVRFLPVVCFDQPVMRHSFSFLPFELSLLSGPILLL